LEAQPKSTSGKRQKWNCWITWQKFTDSFALKSVKAGVTVNGQILADDIDSAAE